MYHLSLPYNVLLKRGNPGMTAIDYNMYLFHRGDIQVSLVGGRGFRPSNNSRLLLQCKFKFCCGCQCEKAFSRLSNFTVSLPLLLVVALIPFSGALLTSRPSETGTRGGIFMHVDRSSPDDSAQSVRILGSRKVKPRRNELPKK